MKLALRDAWIAWRNSLLMSPGFQRWSKAFPLTRPIARQRSRQLFDLLAGFTYSQVLFACVSLGLIDRLSRAAMSDDEIATAIGWTMPATTRLLRAALALGLLDQLSDRRYTLGIHGAALAGNPWIGRFVIHHHLLYQDLARPVDLLAGNHGPTALGRYWTYARSGDGSGPSGDYTELMAASQAAIAEEVLAAYDFGRHDCLLDVGGGDGSFLRAVSRRHPTLRLMLFDLPEVIAIARRHPDADGRIALHQGNFFTDPLPQGADVISLVRIAHDHDDDELASLLHAIRTALPEGGRLVLAEPLSGRPATAPVTDAYFNIYFAAMGQGRTRSAAEFARLGRKAGFRHVSALPTRLPLVTGLVVMQV